ncbi:uncharacterized protein C8Q71DRAFT_125824 [Rhodofomes roseus]|uniref:Uncharacterized protein n=1 Tax=Rhodofomes roseus TaxID=34475 RepID=A0ABQ8KBK0_9APHY|nr:uncharacterized protein C8Q71DRAFT_125824 [Rhodofomes roseus]KAH9834808.1 hypothetical protein C8Q71DRAFT_125824 [Rhodofomes roseus]
MLGIAPPRLHPRVCTSDPTPVRSEDSTCCTRPSLSLQHTFTMGGGARYPYPKQVWSPAGGWWTRPANWKSNTAIAFAGILAVVYAGWSWSAEKEARSSLPHLSYIP